MTKLVFNTGTLLEGPRLGHVESDIESEDMLFQCRTSFAWANGGEHTRAVLELLKQEIAPKIFAFLRIDTRVHMLMPGWYPCIPGWHCDFMRVSDSGAQVPDAKRDAEVQHYQLVTGGPEPEFIVDRNLHVEVDGDVRWRKVDAAMGAAFGTPIEANRIIYFDGNELHRGRPWRGEPGHWRYFFRASYFPEGCAYADKVRRQSQIYCDIHEGW